MLRDGLRHLFFLQCAHCGAQESSGKHFEGSWFVDEQHDSFKELSFRKHGSAIEGTAAGDKAPR